MANESTTNPSLFLFPQSMVLFQSMRMTIGGNGLLSNQIKMEFPCVMEMIISFSHLNLDFPHPSILILTYKVGWRFIASHHKEAFFSIVDGPHHFPFIYHDSLTILIVNEHTILPHKIVVGPPPPAYHFPHFSFIQF